MKSLDGVKTDTEKHHSDESIVRRVFDFEAALIRMLANLLKGANK